MGNFTSGETQKITAKMSSDNSTTFTVDTVMPFLANSTTRTCQTTYTTITQKFVTKVSKISIAIPEADWKEFKEYRSKLWLNTKAWSGKDENEKKKDEKKDGKKDDKKE